MQIHRIPVLISPRPQLVQSISSVAGWRTLLRDLLPHRYPAPTVFQRCLAVHIAYAGARTALS